jgi:hypothetical protein
MNLHLAEIPSPFSTLPTGLYPYGVACGDFHGDGHQDIIVSNSGASSVSVFENSGDGMSFTATEYQGEDISRTMQLVVVLFVCYLVSMIVSAQSSFGLHLRVDCISILLFSPFFCCFATALDSLHQWAMRQEVWQSVISIKMDCQI